MKIKPALLATAIFLFTNLPVHAQRVKLYYFLTKDSLVGVRDQKGKVVIAPRKSFYEEGMHKPIPYNIIYMNTHPAETREPHSWGSAYNREGKFLFAPFAFDNGADFVSEGLSRFVKNGKVGFADRNGDIVIEAKYDYAEAFNYGIAWYCNGCTWKYKGEHGYVSGGYHGYINKKGDTLAISKERGNKKNQPVDSTGFLPYQFSYSAFEQKIIDSFYRIQAIPQIHSVNFTTLLTEEEKQFYYEITERPGPAFPYYRIVVFQYSHRWGYLAMLWEDMDFAVSADGKNFYRLEYDNKRIPLHQWLKKKVTEARKYLNQHPEMPNRF